MANWHHTARKPIRGEIPWLTQLYTPPSHPDASSAETSAVGIRKKILGTR
jgi:hypothetical protein